MSLFFRKEPNHELRRRGIHPQLPRHTGKRRLGYRPDRAPHWEDDGAPAHTVKKFGIVNRYDLSKEFPLLTLRRTYWKTAVDELLWIWQQKSNNIHDLRGHIWDQWADETGSIGKAYGYQLGVKHQYPEGEFDRWTACSMT